MQQTVGEEHRDLRGDRPPRPEGLFSSRFERNDDVAEHARVAGPEFLSALLLLRKRQHIGRAIDFAIIAVEHVDGRVVAEQQGEFGVLEAEGSKHALGPDPNFGGGDRSPLQLSGA